jgi:hypothetical protein
LSLVGVLKAKTFATIYRVLWLTHLVRLFELKTCLYFIDFLAFGVWWGF